PVRTERIGVGDPVPNFHQCHVGANRFDDAGCFVTDDRWKLRDWQCSAAIVDVYKIETDDSVSHQNLVTDGIRNIHSLETKDFGLSILVDTCSCCFGRHIAFLETCKCVPGVSPDRGQHRSKSQVDAFTSFCLILNLLEEQLLPDRIVECRNGLCSTGQISAQRHIQVAEFRYACLQGGPWEPLVHRRDREMLQKLAIPPGPSDNEVFIDTTKCCGVGDLEIT